MKRLIIGCGYLGQRVATAWRDRGDEVWALTRSSDRAAEFTRAGIVPIIGDVLNAGSLTELPAVDTVLYAVGYDRSASPTKREVYVDGLRNVISSLSAECGRLIYISSTSVYGQSQGEWVNETSSCEPTTDGGRICLDAEQVARGFHGTRGVSILRLSGIYGPGRLAARVEALRNKQPIEADPAGWLNLIHVADACQAVLRCDELPSPMETLIVTDDEPLRRDEYYKNLAAAIDAPDPVFRPRAIADLGKRCSNRQLREIPGMTLHYPTIREGLPTALDVCAPHEG